MDKIIQLGTKSRMRLNDGKTINDKRKPTFVAHYNSLRAVA